MSTDIDRSVLVSRSLRAIKWSGLSEFVSRAIMPVTFLLLTRLVAPGEFGLFVGASLVVTFCQVFVESGLTRALIQTKEDVAQFAPSVFWTVLAVAAVMCAGLWLVAIPIAALLLADPSGAGVLMALALQLPLVALGATHRALLERELDYKTLFVCRFGFAVTMSAVSLLCAYAGLGAKSLAIGALTGTTVEVAMLWTLSAFRPALELELRKLRSLAWFGGWTLGQDLLSWLVVYADALIVAAVLDLRQLGTYRLGTLLVTGLFAAVFVPAEKVLFSVFSKLETQGKVGGALCHMVSIGCLLALPVGFALYATRREVEAWVFPETWAGIGLIIGLMGIREAFANVVFAVDPAYKGVGRPDIPFKVRAVNLVLLLGAQVAALPFGFVAFLIARTAATIVALGLILAVARKFFGACERVAAGAYGHVFGVLAALGLACAAMAVEDGARPWRVAVILGLLLGYAVLASKLTRAKIRAYLAG